MQVEVDALDKNNTWQLVTLPPSKNIVGCKWVYRVKYKSDGSIERYKARLVAKGYTQEEGLDYFETFSPVTKLTTVRTLLAISSAKSWFLEQLDVNNAFLHGDLPEEVYMVPPPGYCQPNDTRVCKLIKSLYGLKQASRQWFHKLTVCLLDFGYLQSKSDCSLFVKHKGDSFTALAVYVDDIILAGNDMVEIQQVKDHLHSKFTIKYLGKLRYMLGIEVAQSDKGIVLSQRKYALDLLKDTGYLGSKPASTPMGSKLRLKVTSGELLSDASEYRRLIGRLVYLTITRPDLSFAIQNLSQFMSAPRTEHMSAAHRVLRYIKGAPGYGILLPRVCNLQLKAYSDSD